MEKGGGSWREGSGNNRSKKFGLPVGLNYLASSIPHECMEMKINDL